MNDRKYYLAPTAPYLRAVVPYSAKNLGNDVPISVLGVISNVFDWNTKNQIGTVFFFEIDQDLEYQNILFTVKDIIQINDMTHISIFKTENGYHFVCFDIRKHKVSWCDTWFDFKEAFSSDYEYGHSWILRLTNKIANDPPKYVQTVINSLANRTRMSKAHMLTYVKFCNLDRNTMLELGINSVWINTFCNFVKYKTWNYHYPTFTDEKVHPSKP